MSGSAFEGEMPWPSDPAGQIETGTVGWEDESVYYEKGTDQDDGHTLVRVQLYRGRDFSKPLRSEIGQGKKILCHISGGLFRIPKRGTRVIVAVPFGMEHMPASGCIIATMEKNPLVQFNGETEGDPRVHLNFGDDTHVVIQGKSVTMQDPDARFIAVGTPRSGGAPGLTFQDETGSGGCVQSGAVGWWSAAGGTTKSMMQMTSSGIDLLYKGSTMSLVQLNSGMVTMLADTCNLAGGKNLIGVGPVFAPIINGLSGSIGLPSLSSFVSIP